MRDNRNYRLNSFDVQVMSLLYEEYRKYKRADLRIITALAVGKAPEKITGKDIDSVLFTIEKVNSKPLRIRRSVGNVEVVDGVTEIIQHVPGEAWWLCCKDGTWQHLEVFNILQNMADRGIDISATLKGEE